MLSEIYTLHKNLKRCGVEPEKIHPWLTYHKKADGFIVGIDHSGDVRRIEFLPKEKIAMTWKLMPSNQISFPVFNLKTPIWSPHQSGEEIQTALKGKKRHEYFEQLKTICDEAELYPHNKDKNLERHIQSIEKKFSVFPSELQEILEANMTSDHIFFALLVYVQKTAKKGKIFLLQLSEIAISWSMQNRIESGELIEQLLIGKWHEGERIYKPGDIPIVLDVEDYSRFSFRIFDDEIKNQINKVLLLKKEEVTSKDVCALSGIVGPLESKKFPEPKLPILGQSYLYSMNKDARCHYRYGKVSAANYPVNFELTKELKDSLLFITSPERKGQTWCSVPGSNKKESNLLISYLESMPVSDIDLGFLGDDRGSEGEFEATAKSVCDALKGKPAICSSDQLRLFVLKSVDKGRRQVLFNSTFTIESIFSGIEEWRNGTKNTPSFSLIIPLKKGEKAKKYRPFCPSPTSVMRLFHYQWIRNGLSSSSVHGCRLSDVYNLFFESSSKSEKLCYHFLKRLIKQMTPLLIGIGGAVNSESELNYSIEAKRSTLFAVGLLGILLYKLDHKKEGYMKGEAFQIGRLLSLVDTLHKEYCKVVRKTELPSQLLGNTMMKTALDSPQRALARLNQRLLVYKAWADKGHEEAKLGKWALSEMGEIAQKLENVDLSFRPDEAGQAKILLGYLARNKKNDD
jgi:hypothetical protein